MAKTSHLVRRAGRYYIRRRIPTDLVALYKGKKELQWALGTSDPQLAAVLCRAESVVMDDQFEAARKALQPRGKYWGAVPIEQLEGEEEMSALAAQEDAEADKFEDMVRAFEEALKRRSASAVHAPMQRIHNPTAALPATGNNSLATLIEKWEKERKPTVSTVSAMNLGIQRFRDKVGDLPVDLITKRHAVDFKDALLESGYTGKNTNYMLQQLKGILSYAVGQAWITINPADGVKATVSDEESADARIAFPETVLSSIFSTAIYTDNLRPIQGAGDAAYWLPLLGLFTGARIEELCQLTYSDVRQEAYRDEHGKQVHQWVMLITNEGEGQSLKNKGSKRRLPIHAELLARGFVEYVDSRKGEDRLFATRPNAKGRKSAQWSVWWHAYIRKACEIKDKRLVFHSFRHTFKDVCRECGIDKGVRDALQGHTEKGAAGGYGGEYYPLRPLVEAMNKYKVIGVTLPVPVDK
jgi:integrase